MHHDAMRRRNPLLPVHTDCNFVSSLARPQWLRLKISLSSFLNDQLSTLKTASEIKLCGELQLAGCI